jgi:hypothetical protein
MSSRSNGEAYEPETVVPFAPKNAASSDADQLDRAGQTILQLLHKAAGVAEENSRYALDMAQKLSHQLRAAENRIAALEAEVGIYQDKADRASSGCTRSIRRSRIDFCGRTTLPEVCQAPRNDIGRKSLRSVHLSEEPQARNWLRRLGSERARDRS